MILVMNRSTGEHDTVRGLFDETQPSEDEKAEKGPLEKEFLPSGFQPKEWDVICHNGKEPKSHVGNRRFKVIVQNYLSSYVKAKSRSLKSAVISDIISVIRSKSTHNGGFVRYDDVAKRWYEVGDKVARDKVGHSLREAMRATEPSSPSGSMSPSEAVAYVTGSSTSLEPSSSPIAGRSPSYSDIMLEPDQIQSSGSPNLESISGESHGNKEEETPVAMNLADWFEADSRTTMDDS
ncbi:unnamed protein product [Cylindrotheca closterium]|uniref:DUF6824 domain-containing protein n=1 Tax=Cylindrotheca closterium TaxID=2856 RepID=A0AAD2GBQ2_9STRA|nr:unnamed protein product [Cylindrotheca closterium]